MGYIDNTLVTIDSIVTAKGRELLSKGRGRFKVTKFAVADDEIDYRLWDSNNVNGSVYYGQVIENMSLTEANPNQDKTMNFKMLSLPKNIELVPVMAIAGGNYSPTIQSTEASPYSDPFIITPMTYNPSTGNSILGYTATVSDTSVLTLEGQGTNVTGGSRWAIDNGELIYNFSTSKTEAKATGTSFKIHPAKSFPIGYSGTRTASITIIGNETAGKLIVNITVKPWVKTTVPDIPPPTGPGPGGGTGPFLKGGGNLQNGG